MKKFRRQNQLTEELRKAGFVIDVQESGRVDGAAPPEGRRRGEALMTAVTELTPAETLATTLGGLDR